MAVIIVVIIIVVVAIVVIIIVEIIIVVVAVVVAIVTWLGLHPARSHELVEHAAASVQAGCLIVEDGRSLSAHAGSMFCGGDRPRERVEHLRKAITHYHHRHDLRHQHHPHTLHGHDDCNTSLGSLLVPCRILFQHALKRLHR